MDRVTSDRRLSITEELSFFLPILQARFWCQGAAVVPFVIVLYLILHMLPIFFSVLMRHFGDFLCAFCFKVLGGSHMFSLVD